MMPETDFEMAFDERAVDAIFAQFNQSSLPGVAVGVAIGGRPVYRKAFGLATLEQPLALSSTTRLRIASVTKQFTCLAYLLLCEAGKARIDDPIGNHLPELSPASRSPSIRQLMSHTSGLRDGCDWFFYDLRGRISSADVLAFYRETADVNGPAGVTLRYNDGAYLLLGVAIERIADCPLEEVFRRSIFDPIGMHDTQLCRWDDQAVRNSSAAYMKSHSGGFEKALRFIEGGGQGGMMSTVDDMLRWLCHMSAPIVGQPATWTLMKSPQLLANGTRTAYGLGLATGRYRDSDTLWHNGMVMGSRSQMLKVPAAGLDIIVLANRDDVVPVDLANKILDTCMPGVESRGKVAVPCAAGTFLSASTGRLIRLSARDGQQVVSIDGADYLFGRSGDRTLHSIAASSIRRQTIELRGSLEEPASITFSDHGNTDDLYAVQPPAAPNVSAILGHYECGSTDMRAAIADGLDGPYLTTRSRFGSTVYKLECLAEGIWGAKSTGAIPLSGILSFDADGVLRLTTRATWALRFARGRS